jgi:hypothetical protein
MLSEVLPWMYMFKLCTKKLPGVFPSLGISIAQNISILQIKHILMFFSVATE